MQDTLNTPETTSAPTESASRRAFLTQVAALGAGVAALQIVAHAQTMGQMPMTPGAPMAPGGMMPGAPMMPPGMMPGSMTPPPMMPGAMPMAPPDPAMMRPAAMPKNEMQYRMAIAPVGMLSLEASRIASVKAVDPAVRQFATFELNEQIALNAVLKDLGTPMPPMSPMDMATLDRARNTPAGPDFDCDYTSKQRADHIFLRDTALAYLGSPMPRKAKLPEKHGRHLATMNVPAHQEHITHTEDILGRMMAMA